MFKTLYIISDFIYCFVSCVLFIYLIFLFFEITTAVFFKNVQYVLKKKSYLMFLIYFQCRLIVSQMSSTRCESFNTLLYPIGLALAYVFLFSHQSQFEVQIVWALLILSVLAHIHYGVCVVSHLFIYLVYLVILYL